MFKTLISAVLLCTSVLSYAQTCPSDMELTAPTSDFEDNGDGTVTHLPTGLMWARCAAGNTWNGSTETCDGLGTTHNWSSALQVAENYSFAGHDDWRLPNIKELMSIVELGCSDNHINETVFPLIGTGNYWASTPNISNGIESRAWSVVFGRSATTDSLLSAPLKSDGNEVLFVRQP